MRFANNACEEINQSRGKGESDGGAQYLGGQDNVRIAERALDLRERD